MTSKRRTLIVRLAVLVFVSLASLCAQPYPDAASLLSRGAETLSKYHSYEYTTDMTMDISGMSIPIATTMLTQAVNPGKIRMESKAAGMNVALVVSDGEHSWTYIPFLKQYTKTDGSEGMPSVTESMWDV